MGFSMSNVARVLNAADPWLKMLIVGGTVAYLVEISITDLRTTATHPWFRAIEVVIALCFTAEYILRWMDDLHDHYGWHYPHSPLGLIDLVSLLPFWLGWCVPVDWLHFVRTFRVFRLLKFFRYSRSLQLVALGFYRAAPALRPLGFGMLIVGLFCTVAIFELERDAQPDKFRTLYDAAYFTMVTVATVGYGDITPVTPLGRFVVMLTFVTGLAIFAGILGVMGASFFKVMEEEIDPTIDPLEEFRKEWERHQRRRSLPQASTSDVSS
jgi:voltage-gated potassium channel